jgi:hypothetical protein
MWPKIAEDERALLGCLPVPYEAFAALTTGMGRTNLTIVRAHPQLMNKFLAPIDIDR